MKMGLTVDVTVSDGVAVLVLKGEVDATSAGQLNQRILEVSEQPLRELMLNASELTYLSSAGLRCLVYAHQRLGRKVRIVLAGASPEVADTIRMAGFDRSITMRERAGM